MQEAAVHRLVFGMEDDECQAQGVLFQWLSKESVEQRRKEIKVMYVLEPFRFVKCTGMWLGMVYRCLILKLLIGIGLDVQEEMSKGYFDDFRTFRESNGKIFGASKALIPKHKAESFPTMKVGPPKDVIC